jgi:hypothetical protein
MHAVKEEADLGGVPPSRTFEGEHAPRNENNYQRSEGEYTKHIDPR